MFKKLFLLVSISLIALFACNKKGPAKACFELSKDKIKLGDTLYLLNCSENFQKFIWETNMGFDSIHINNKVVPTQTGSLDIKLYVGTYKITTSDLSAAKSVTKTVTVE